MKRLNVVIMLLAAIVLIGLADKSYATSYSRIDNNGYYGPIKGTAEDRAEFIKTSGTTSYTRGGAINNSAGGWITSIIYAYFYENQAKYGGAINNFTTAKIDEIINSEFYSNTATSNGGAIYSDGVLTRITSTDFKSNAANGDRSSGAGYGGAIYADLVKSSDSLTIVNSNFTGNYAYRKGGAIAIMRGDLNIIAKSGYSEFSGNTQSLSDDNDIYFGGNKQTLNLAAYGTFEKPKENSQENNTTTTDEQSSSGDEPSVGGDEPSGGGDEPSGGGDEPSGGGDEPSGGGDEPSGGGDEPSGGGDEPSGGGDESSGGGDEPSGGGDEPSGGGDEPSGGGESSDDPENSYILLNDGIDFSKNLTININPVTSDSKTVGTGTIYINGDVGSPSLRAALNLYGGKLSLSTNKDQIQNFNTIYAGKMSIYNDTMLEFDIGLDENYQGNDSLNFTSVTGAGKLTLKPDSFKINGYFDNDWESVTLDLLSSPSSFRKYVQMYDNKNNPVNIVYQYDSEGSAIFKIRLTSDGQFIISVPKYIDEITNPLAYAVNYLYNSDHQFNAYTLTLKKNISIDSWEDYPNSEGVLEPRNIQRPTHLYIEGNKKTITADYNLQGMVINDAEKTLDVKNTTFQGFKTTVNNSGGNVYFYNTGFIENKNAEGKGGAILNDSGIMTIEGKKSGNKTLFYNNIADKGGAVYNKGKLNIIYGTFGKNKTKKVNYSNEATYGGAVYNLQQDIPAGDESAVTNLIIENSTFVDNKANYGGAIYNTYSNDEEPAVETVMVTGNFRRNNAEKTGGAIYNKGYLTVSGSVFGKSGKSAEANIAQDGGAVINASGGKYVSENTSYYSNIAKGSDTLSGEHTAGKGGAVYNTTGAETTIKGGSFTSNQADYGGAIFNDVDTDEDTPTRLILDGYTNPTSQKLVVTVFSKNISDSGYGGAIYNLGTIAPTVIVKEGLPVAGDFKTNKATFDVQNYDKVMREDMYTIGYSPKGGAIYNEGTLELNEANFTSNSATANVNVSTLGYQDGSKYGTAKITKQTGKGGAIYSDSTKDLYITSSEFVKNTSVESGGAIHNEQADSDVHVINSKFNSNKSSSTLTTVMTITRENGRTIKSKKETTKVTVGTGGAISSTGNVSINDFGCKYSEFIEDKQDATQFTSNTAAKGGAIYSGKNANINNSTFSKNTATYTCSCNNKEVKEKTIEEAVARGEGSGGAVYSETDVNITNSVFSNNKATEKGGASYSRGNININPTHYVGTSSYDPLDQNVSFSNNSAKEGGAVYSAGTVFIKDTVFTSNKATSGNGGAINTKEGMQIVNTDFTKNSAVNGGAIYVDEGKTTYLINTNFTNNKASKLGGAIYASKNSNVYLVAYSKDIVISGNKAGSASSFIKEYGKDAAISAKKVDTSTNFIYLEDNSTLYIYSRKSDPTTSGNYSIYTVTINDNILGKPGENAKVVKLNDAYVYINGLVVGASISTSGSDVEQIVANNCARIIKSDTYQTDLETTDPTGLGRSSGLLHIAKESNIQNCDLELVGSQNLSIANDKIGTLSINKLYIEDNTTTNVSIDADLKSGEVDKITAQKVEGTGVLNVSALKLTSDNKSKVNLKLGEDSLVTTMSVKQAESLQATYKLKSSLDENGHLRATAYGQKAKPTVLAAPVAAQIGGFLTQVNSYDQAFTNLDMEMILTREERQAQDNMNKYAMSEGYFNGFDNGINRDSKGLWNRAYATFERVNLSHGPKVGNIGYGDFFGGDMGKKELSNGWKRQFSAYIGYNGSTQDFDRQSIDQNGGTLGIMETWYKGNFFTALTANVSGNFADASTDIGKERMAMLMAGIASKTGYNFEFCKGKFILQPSLLLSYSFVHTFSHRNGLGNKVGSSPLHGIQVAPGVKFIFNLPKGWQPYMGINMRWNIVDKTHFSLQDVNIPDMSINPYVEYGIGLQRRWGERFTGYGQAMVRNGGRNGVMLSFGFRWLIGK